jgi:hypothetical protein
MPLEVLNFPFMLFRGSSSAECPQVPAATGLLIQLARVQSVLAIWQFANHDSSILQKCCVLESRNRSTSTSNESSHLECQRDN